MVDRLRRELPVCPVRDQVAVGDGLDVKADEPLVLRGEVRVHRGYPCAPGRAGPFPPARAGEVLCLGSDSWVRTTHLRRRGPDGPRFAYCCAWFAGVRRWARALDRLVRRHRHLLLVSV